MATKYNKTDSQFSSSFFFFFFLPLSVLLFFPSSFPVFFFFQERNLIGSFVFFLTVNSGEGGWLWVHNHLENACFLYFIGGEIYPSTGFSWTNTVRSDLFRDQRYNLKETRIQE